MKRRTLLTAAAGLPLGAAAALTLAQRQPWRSGDPPRGTVLMLVVDDLNGWLSCLRSQPPLARTPAIDQLAKRGTLFRHAYCPAPYCNASRMAVFSGLWPSTSGVYEDQPFWEQPGRAPTYLEAFKAAGYTMVGAGKVLHGRYGYREAQGRPEALWIEQENRAALWDQFVDSAPQPLPLDRPLSGIERFVPSGRPISPQLDWGVLPAEDEQRHPDVITADAVERWLLDPPDQPLFCAAGFYSPHLPWYAPERFLAQYPLESIVLPAVLNTDLDDVPPIGRRWAQNPPDHLTITSHGQWRQAVQGYLACVSFVDSLIGKVLAALERSPLRESTTVVLWSDNGFHLGEKLHWRKFTLWEEATRVPLIVAPSPQRLQSLRLRPEVEEPVSVLDVCPTLCALEGLPPVPGSDGRSLLPLMREGAGPEQGRPVLMSWGEGNHSIRWQGWRYIRYRDGGEELYHQPSDPQEWHNRSGDPALTAVQQQLRGQLDALLQRPPA